MVGVKRRGTAGTGDSINNRNVGCKACSDYMLELITEWYVET